MLSIKSTKKPKKQLNRLILVTRWNATVAEFFEERISSMSSLSLSFEEIETGRLNGSPHHIRDKKKQGNLV